MNLYFKNKNVLITGAGGELGSALVRAFVQQGAIVAGLYHRSTPSEHVTASASADFRQPASIAAAVQGLEGKTGPVDILINNAGITGDGLLSSLAEDVIGDILTVNLQAALLVSRALLPGMISRRQGCILNISSLAGCRPVKGQATYAAAKAGLDGMTRALAVEVAARQIRVNALAPGYLDSRLVDNMGEDKKAALLAAIPCRRLGTMEEAADTAVFLCSERASYITGQIFYIDGGMGM